MERVLDQVRVEEATELAFQIPGWYYRVSEGSYRIQNNSEQKLGNLGSSIGPVELGAKTCLSVDV